MKNLFKRLAARWRQLQPRERRLAIWCGVIVSAGLLLSVDDWQRSEHRRLQKSIPAAETRLATMQKMADELDGYAAASRNEPPASSELVAASLKASGLQLTTAATGSSQFVIRGEVAFDDWINWLSGLAAQGWRVERALVQRQGTSTASAPAGPVKVEATLGATGG
jgi:type II secretory pathway component PulM